jgi:membrane protein implicated in regulation of membrane protease activity
MKQHFNPKVIILLFAVAALIFGNHLLKTSGTISLIMFLSGFILIFLGTWKLLYPYKTNKSWLNRLFILFLGLFIVFLSIWLPALLWLF